MKNAVHIFLFGGFVGSRLLDEPEAVWQDPVFDDPTGCDDGVGWQLHIVPGGKVYSVAEGVGERCLRLFEGSEAQRGWKLIARFDYQGGKVRQDALDALNKFVADRVGFVEQPVTVVDRSAGS